MEESVKGLCRADSLAAAEIWVERPILKKVPVTMELNGLGRAVLSSLEVLCCSWEASAWRLRDVLEVCNSFLPQMFIIH